MKFVLLTLLLVTLALTEEVITPEPAIDVTTDTDYSCYDAATTIVGSASTSLSYGGYTYDNGITDACYSSYPSSSYYGII